MSAQEISTIGQCDKCGAQVRTVIPDALRNLLARAGSNEDRVSDQADRLQVVVLLLHKLQDDLVKGDRFEVADAGRVQEIIEVATREAL